MKKANLCFADFSGAWSLKRFITDRRAVNTGQFIGTTEFSPIEGGYSLKESGLLTLTGQSSLSASRQYIWREAGQIVNVFFDDGRFFHSFNLAETQPVARHDCPPDTYDVRYEFKGKSAWTSVWNVVGPHKDYEMQSEYLKNDYGDLCPACIFGITLRKLSKIKENADGDCDD